MFKELLSRIAQALNTKSIPYMIIGGQAVILYGEPRLTRDIDITLGVGIEKLLNMIEVINNLSLKALSEDVESFVQRTMVLPTIDEPSGIRVDFIFSFTPYEKQAIERARKILVDNTYVSFASPEDVIVHKIFAGRPRDLEDVTSMLLKNPDIDKVYIKKWLQRFEEAVPEKQFKRIFEELLKEL